MTRRGSSALAREFWDVLSDAEREFRRAFMTLGEGGFAQ